MHFTLEAVPWAVMSVVLAALAGTILVRQRASRVATLFVVMIGLVAVWFGAMALLLSSLSPGRALIFAKVVVAGVLFLPSAMYDFTATALRIHAERRPVIAAAWAASVAFFLLLVSGDAVVSGVHHYRWGFYPRMGSVGVIFIVFCGTLLAGHLVEYVVEYVRTEDRVRRRRLRDLGISFGIVYLAAVDFLPMFGFERRPVGYVPILIFVLYAWRSIRHHRLSSITAARAAPEILETMADSLFVIDGDHRIRVINPAARKLFGYSEMEILGRSIESLEAPEFHGSIAHTLGDLGVRGAIRDQERLFVDHQGHRIDVSISISPIVEQDTEEGAVVIVRDIRARKRSEEEFRAFTQKLQQSNRELEDFAYVASHDLQEPLRKIQAFGDRLKEKHGQGLPPEAIDYLSRMQGAALRMQVLINDLLNFSRVTTKAQPFKRVDLTHIAQEVLKDLEVLIHELQGSVQMEELPQIDADPLQMRQLLQNLIGNALKFHRPGVPPVVRISGSILSEPTDSLVEVIVSDNGIGFDEKYADRIFTMFERLHGRGSYEGTGIGLAICRKIAQRHGGDVRAESAPAQGATFIVTLPLHHHEMEITVQ